MKKLTVLCSALLLAATSFAGEVTYDLQGGVTNDYGWTSKSDMFTAFMNDAGVTGFETLEYYMAQTDPLGGTNICGKLTDASPALKMEKWVWLKSYIETVTAAYTAAGTTPAASALTADGTGAAWRYAVGAFFCSMQRTSWPASADFSSAGLDVAYIPTWKHAYANPTSVTEGEFILNAPYKEGESFRGWYDNAAGTGTPVTKITPESEGTLYACFGEYINTIAEVLALADGTATKVKGTVSYTAGSNFWIQDATGAILCDGKDNGVANGEEVTLSGTFVANYYGSPELNNATVVSKMAGTPVSPTEVALSQLVADTASYLNKLVLVKGLTFSKYVTSGSESSSYTTPYVSDGLNEIALYKYSNLTETDYPVGTQVNVKAVFSRYGTNLQLRGETSWLEASAAANKDTYTYPARGENGEYTLENKWIISTQAGNYADNLPGPTDYVRGMVAKDGKMYFINRDAKAFTVVDGATGKKLSILPITGEHLFQVQGEDGEWSNATTLAYNDVKVDNAGNMLIGACLTSSQTFFIYKVDPATGAATELIKERLWDNTEEEFDKINYRFDAFGVYGDINSHAIVMAQDANSMTAFKWVIDNGVAAKAEKVVLYVDPVNDNSYLITDGAMIANPGTAPQIFPVDDNYFYIDGWSTLPTLFNMDGTLADDFKNCKAGLEIVNNEGDACTLNVGHNGLAEFQIGDDYFLVMAATNTAGTPASAFALYKYKDASKAFADMTPMWFFPNAGMGTGVNGFRTAVPSVEVKDNVATIYLYAGNVGYGVYTFTGVKATGVDNVMDETAKVQKVMENGQLYILKDGVRYNVLGTVVK